MARYPSPLAPLALVTRTSCELRADSSLVRLVGSNQTLESHSVGHAFDDTAEQAPVFESARCTVRVASHVVQEWLSAPTSRLSPRVW